MRTKEEKLRQRGIAENERIDFSTLEAHRVTLLKRIADGDVFTLDDVNKCRLLIMQEYPEYKGPITAQSGILFAVEAIRKSFGRKYFLPNDLRIASTANRIPDCAVMGPLYSGYSCIINNRHLLTSSSVKTSPSAIRFKRVTLWASSVEKSIRSFSAIPRCRSFSSLVLISNRVR